MATEIQQRRKRYFTKSYTWTSATNFNFMLYDDGSEMLFDDGTSVLWEDN